MDFPSYRYWRHKQVPFCPDKKKILRHQEFSVRDLWLCSLVILRLISSVPLALVKGLGNSPSPFFLSLRTYGFPQISFFCRWCNDPWSLFLWNHVWEMPLNPPDFVRALLISYFFSKRWIWIYKAEVYRLISTSWFLRLIYIQCQERTDGMYPDRTEPFRLHRSLFHQRYFPVSQWH